MTKPFPKDHVTCMGPWYHFRIYSSGRVSPCDAFQDQYPADRVDTWYQSGQVPVQVRELMQQGEPVAGCRRCYHTESTNTISFRQRFNLQAGIHSGPWFQHSLHQSPAWPRMQSTQLTEQQKPTFLSVTFDNQCSAACRMCLPRHSTTVAKVWQDLGIDQYDDESVKFDPTAPLLQSWAHDQEKYQSLLRLVVDNPDLMYLKINGGEPFAHPSVTRFLQDCVNAGAVNFDLYITTNGTIWDQDFVTLIRQFRRVMIDLSIEGFHPTNDYIRIGTSYQQVQQNIQRFQALVSPEFEVKIHTLPQLLSVEHYDTAVDFCLDMGLPLYGNPLYTPRHHMIEILPDHHKLRLWQRFSQRYDLAHRQSGSVVEQTNFNAPENNQIQGQVTATVANQLIKILHLLETPDRAEYEKYRRDFVRYTRLYDQHFGVSFLDFYPELEDFFHEYS
jgi:MoaA/NifB/PqqE/SkfB family radical SAM enzyme